MEIFTQKERAYLSDGPTLARIATVGKDGTPHVVPVGWSYNADAQAIEIGGVDLEKTMKYRDVQRNGHRPLRRAVDGSRDDDALENAGSLCQGGGGKSGCRLGRRRWREHHAVAVRNDGLDRDTFQQFRQRCTDSDGSVDRTHAAIERQQVRRVGQPQARGGRETVEGIA